MQDSNFEYVAGANDIAHATNNDANNTQAPTRSDGVVQNECVRAGQGSSEQVENNIANIDLDS